MNRPTRPIDSTVIVECSGAFLSITDQSSLLNDESYWSPTISPKERHRQVKELVRHQEAFEWNPILDGVFRIDAIADHRDESIEGPNIVIHGFALNLPTGVLVLRSTLRTTPFLTLRPGRYDGVLLWDLSSESEHSLIGTVEKYPSEEGPDGIVWIWPLR
jgi:hypothetical protein